VAAFFVLLCKRVCPENREGIKGGFMESGLHFLDGNTENEGKNNKQK
jgi:hypothetical protein